MDKTESIGGWNKKRILIALLIVIMLGVGAYSFLNKKFFPSNFLKSVKGISVQKEKIKDVNSGTKNTSSPIQAVIKQKLDDLKKEVNSLNVVDIATSSPQVQKIINDLNSLKEYPMHEVKDICQKICGGL